MFTWKSFLQFSPKACDLRTFVWRLPWTGVLKKSQVFWGFSIVSHSTSEIFKSPSFSHFCFTWLCVGSLYIILKLSFDYCSDSKRPQILYTWRFQELELNFFISNFNFKDHSEKEVFMATVLGRWTPCKRAISILKLSREWKAVMWSRLLDNVHKQQK